MNNSLGQAALPGNPGQTKSEKPRFPMGPLAGIVLLSAAVGAGFGAVSATLVDNNGGTTPAAATQANTASTAGSAASLTPAGSQVSVAALYTKLRPEVVKITATSAASGATGSGLILDTKGNIATNYHVVSGSNKLDVQLSDGTIKSATVVGTDPGDDLAVIHIDPSGLSLSPVTLANSSQTQVGDSVVAIGNPLDLEATLTEGVVSGLGRVLNGNNGSRPLRELIQTDTAINPGNSGGGLFNLNGELVGITNALENPSGQDSFSGIGYAIPASTLKTYLPQMLAGQTVQHAKLGVSLEALTPDLASQLGLSVDQGVLIGSVDPSSAAARAGLRGVQTNAFGQTSGAGDVIVAIDGKPVKTYDDIASYLDTKNPGDQVTLTIIRNGQQQDVSLNLDAWTS